MRHTRQQDYVTRAPGTWLKSAKATHSHSKAKANLMLAGQACCYCHLSPCQAVLVPEGAWRAQNAPVRVAFVENCCQNQELCEV